MPIPIDKMLCLVGLGVWLGVLIVFTLGSCRMAGRKMPSSLDEVLKIEP